ncbi:MAG: PIG-L family deacetylase [Planctomycetota bacterium]|nr:PIG-L family deacetylase [Planctomycetota bacterium]
MPEKPNIVCLVGHPDDVTFIMGGTALLLKDSYQFHVVLASRGERGYEWKGNGLPPPRQDIAETRCAEEAEACAMFGATLQFLDQPDSEIHADRAACEKAAEILRKLKPAALFTHWPCEKPDHAATWGIAWKALHLAELFWSTEVYMGLMAGDDRCVAKPDFYVNISAVFEQKLKMIALHKSHAVEWTRILSEYNGMLGKQTWCKQAEAFAAGLPPMAERWNRRAGSILMDIGRPA